MLPGFRFLFAAILLSTSILVFGVGAAALLRTAHEEFVVNPSWRNQPQEQEFARATAPVLAVLRAEPTASQQTVSEPAPSLRDQIPTIALPLPDADQSAQVTLDTLAQADKIAAEIPPAAPVQQPALAAADPAAPAADTAAPASQDKDGQVKDGQDKDGRDNGPADAAAATPAPASEPQQADAAAPATIAPVAPAPVEAAAPAPTEAGPITTAALGDATVSADKTRKAKAKAASPATEKAINRVHRPKKRHRIVRRPPPPPVQQSYDPFATPQQPALTTTRSR